MKIKNLLVGGVVAIALLLGMGVGTARSQFGENPDGNNSAAAFALSFQIFTDAQNAVASANASGDSAELSAAFDVLVVSELTILFLSLYQEDFPNFTTGEVSYLQYFDYAQGANLALSGLAQQLIGTGNPVAQQILAASQLLNTTLANAANATTTNDG